jgi:hypothetical protein
MKRLTDKQIEHRQIGEYRIRMARFEAWLYLKLPTIKGTIFKTLDKI